MLWVQVNAGEIQKPTLPDKPSSVGQKGQHSQAFSRCMAQVAEIR